MIFLLRKDTSFQKLVYLLILLLISFATAYAQNKINKQCIDSYTISLNEADSTVLMNESKVVFKFTGPTGTPLKSHLKLVVNGDTLSPKLSSAGICKQIFAPGKCTFTFIVPFWHIVRTDSIKLMPGQKCKVIVHFKAVENKLGEIEYGLGKPVIYLYPPETTQVNVQVKVNGKITFSYPLYKGARNLTAFPNGDLEHDGRKLRYLFWEGEKKFDDLKIKWSQGFKISSDSLISFFETSLKASGLTDYEVEDFITFWVPKMKEYKLTYIHFLFGNECENISNLDINPKPDVMIRLYVLWDNGELYPGKPEPQLLPEFKRKGFTAVEWGGTELKGSLRLLYKN